MDTHFRFQIFYQTLLNLFSNFSSFIHQDMLWYAIITTGQLLYYTALLPGFKICSNLTCYVFLLNPRSTYSSMVFCFLPLKKSSTNFEGSDRHVVSCCFSWFVCLLTNNSKEMQVCVVIRTYEQAVLTLGKTCAHIHPFLNK